MFVTKRGLSDACHVVGSRLDQVSENVVGTRRHLAGRIDRVGITLDETQQIIEGTRDEVAVIHGDLTSFQEDLQSVNLVVQTLESKMGRLECSQDQTVDGIHNLCEFTRKMETAQTKNGNAVVGQVPSPPVAAAIGSCSEQRIVMRATCLPRPAPPRLSLEAAASASHVADQESSSPSSRAQEPSSSQASSVPPPSHHDGIMSSSSTDQDEAAGSINTPHQPPQSSNHQTGAGTRTTTASRRFGGLSLQSGLGSLLSAATPAALLGS
ncbi:hypothetical protein BS78_09G006000 [Paspalum vaginatum]|nr:hypothetical protein BS78_09G006000 [Paspalum vaginatum]